MKLAKFIYPMFLVAIGLHGLLLFVPIGDSESDRAEEDIALSDLPTRTLDRNQVAAKPSDIPLDALPVPDPNVSVGGAQPFGSLLPTARTPVASARTSAGTSPSAPRPAAIVRLAATSSAPVARTTPSAANTTRAGTASQSAGSSSTGPSDTGPSNAGASNAGAARNGASSSSSSGDLPALPPADWLAAEPSRPNLPDVSDTSGDTSENASAGVTGLIASATGSVSQALKSLSSDFAADFTYIETDTDAAGTLLRRQAWRENISQQANIAAGETVEPILLPEAAGLSYPIEVSKQDDRRAFRICLEPEPNDAEVAVLFDSRGNVVGAPVMTRSSGYLAIDKEILALAAAAEGFPSDRQSKAYTLAFDIDYVAERCVSLPKLTK